MDLRPNRLLRSESASEAELLQRELRCLITERDILKKRSATMQRTRRKARLHRAAS